MPVINAFFIEKWILEFRPAGESRVLPSSNIGPIGHQKRQLPRRACATPRTPTARSRRLCLKTFRTPADLRERLSCADTDYLGHEDTPAALYLSNSPPPTGPSATAAISYQVARSRSPHRSRLVVKDQSSGACPPSAKALCLHAR